MRQKNSLAANAFSFSASYGTAGSRALSDHGMGTRRKSREIVLQMLFQSDMGKQNADQVRRTFWAEHGSASAEVRGFADDLFRVATDRGSEIDLLIEKHA